MATRLESQPYDTATANFQLWTGFIRNLILTTCGWTQTSDTGQTNPTTVGTAPTTGNYVYEVYQATDSLAGTNPLVVKMEYGQNQSCPSIGITVGTGSNGSGTVTGGGSRICTLNNSGGTGGALGATGYDCVGSGDGSGFRFLMWRNHPTGNVPAFFGVERARNPSGSYIGDYATLFVYGFNIDLSTSISGNSQQIFRQQTVLAGGSAGNIELTWLTFQTPNASAGLGANVAAVPMFPMPGYLGNPSMDILCGKGGDFAEASTTNSIQIYGASHNYYFTKVGNLFQLGSLAYGAANYNNNESNTSLTAVQGLLFRYE